jgi:hypothetical protein
MAHPTVSVSLLMRYLKETRMSSFRENCMKLGIELKASKKRGHYRRLSDEQCKKIILCYRLKGRGPRTPSQLS